MLGRLRPIFEHHLQAAFQSLNYLCNQPLSTLTTALVIAITLALPALFWALGNNLQNLANNWQRQGQISLYLQLNLSEAEQNAIVHRVQAIKGIDKVTLISPQEGLDELRQQEEMHDIMAYLPQNPLPAVISVQPNSNLRNALTLKSLLEQLHSISGVEQVKVDMDWIKKLDALLSFVMHFAHALFALLAFAVLFVIGTTLTLALQVRHEEIQVMKLIGAKNSFIMRPFLYAGIWYGVIGAVLAVFLVNIFIFSLSFAVSQLAYVYNMSYSIDLLSIRQILLLILFAIILGWLGACFSVRRQLASIEPQI